MAKISCLFFFLAFSPHCVQARPLVRADEVGIDEHLGGFIPADLSFLDEEGRPVRLDSLIDKPTILSLVYYRCPSICKPLLGSLSEVIAQLDLALGGDYRVVTVSFDPGDGPSDSMRMKRNFASGPVFETNEGGWRFLTGDSVAIATLTSAVGFMFKRQGRDFLHPAAIAILSGDGRIVRYLYGTKYLPFDLKMALTEASEGRVGGTVVRVLQYCFSYDPDGRRYVFNLTRVVGTVVLLFAAAFAAYLVITGKRYRKMREGSNES